MTMSKYRIQANRTKPHICLEKFPWDDVAMWSHFPPSVSTTRTAKIKSHLAKAYEFANLRNLTEGRFPNFSGKNAHVNKRPDVINLHLKGLI